MLFGLISTVFAQGPPPIVDTCQPGTGNLNLASCLKLSDSTQLSTIYNNPAFLVNLLVNNIFVVAGIIFFFMMIVAGFKFLTGGQKGAEDSKNIITTSIIGFLIMFSAYWVIQIISLLTGYNISGVGP